VLESPTTTNGGLFSGAYDYAMWPFERAFIGAWRRRLASRVHGKVLEIGAGTGASFPWYPAGVEVVAIEPSEAMAARARERARAAIASVDLVVARAEELPFADASFDATLSTFTWCSVADPVQGLAEVRRVLMPGGELLLIEHVHLPWEPGRIAQSVVSPLWEQVAGGCHLDRDTERLVREAGFEVTERRQHVLDWIVELVARRS